MTAFGPEALGWLRAAKDCNCCKGDLGTAEVTSGCERSVAHLAVLDCSG